VDRCAGGRKDHSDGFTLVEVLFIVVILGILAAVVAFAVGPILSSGSSKAKTSDAEILSSAEDAFFANQDTGRYATETELMSARLLHTASALNSLCVDLAPTNGDYFVVQGVPATQAAGNAACAATASAYSPPKAGSYLASAGTPAVP
jgi:prepilin-type N-terminal cleavage/methylation domain-containing protein